ncbi:alpha/beta hydrolase [Gordonia sputi]|uniref:Putative esterase n=1 Tax=Gordonia sputi NBRC 100414 TaxID=1089453 RepID=H5TUQ2_9ACTN|nr:alpha/beta hydrolase [Gordonia sputi]NKY95592.1 alpha/beta hydrolase [Gordonia sputi]GAB37210.1 putative esterase [Gordonia sputi NBRC 100414]
MTIDDIAPDLRRTARWIPRGIGLRHMPQAVLRLGGVPLARLRGVPTVSIAPGVSIRLHRPTGAQNTGTAMLWIHGGGYVLGSAGQDDIYCRDLADATGITVAAVNYRLAPQFPYPTPLEDCYTALAWLAEQPWVDSNRIAIGGASAGGGLTAALALLARDRGDIPLAAQALVYPMLDDRTAATPTGRRYVLWSESDNKRGWDLYLGAADRQRAVPARRADLDGLPPTWLGVGTCDLFHDETLDYARRLREAGVDCEVEVADGAFHAFDQLVPKAPTTQRFNESLRSFLRRKLASV